MKLEKIAGFPAISSDAFLVIYDLGQELLNGKTNEVQKFWVNCRRFLDELIRDVVSHRSATSGVSRGLYSFCPEILLEGDNNSIFGCLLVSARYWLIALLFRWDSLTLLLTIFIALWWRSVGIMLVVSSQRIDFLILLPSY